jgi:DNA/RNA endonuclease YhcR with UshA esterase domain
LIVWGLARRSTVPTLLARDLDHTANWAFVQMRGVVTRYPTYDQESGYLGFWIDDDSGEVLVTAYRNTSRALIAAGNVPVLGDVATVQGTVRVKSDWTVLVLNAPEHLAVERPEAIETSIDRVAEYVHHKVQVRGQVRDVRTPYEGLTVLHLRDETGEIEVIYDRDLIHLSGLPSQVLVGDSVSVRGVVTTYKGEPQISLDVASGLQRLSQDVAVALLGPIGEIGFGDEDRWVRVQGLVTEVYPLSIGRKCVLNDGTGEIALLLWENVLNEVATRIDVRQGVRLDVQGVVAEYRGELEVIPELARDVRALPWVDSTVVSVASQTATAWVTPAETRTLMPEPSPTGTDVAIKTQPTWTRSDTLESTPALTRTAVVIPTAVKAQTVTATSTPEQQFTPTGFWTAAHVGQQATVRGRIEESTQFVSGVKSYVDDGSGPIVVWIPQGIYEKLASGAGWWVGSLVRVTGRVEQYKNETEIVPSDVQEIVIIDAAALLPGPIVPIGELSAARLGEQATVEAEIVEIEPFSQGIKFLLDDGSAQITLLLWQNVLDAVSMREQMVVGAAIRAMGQVQEYRGELELVPGMGTDVALVTHKGGG